jgi:hypothetical protein
MLCCKVLTAREFSHSISRMQLWASLESCAFPLFKIKSTGRGHNV